MLSPDGFLASFLAGSCGLLGGFLAAFWRRFGG
jgi:hypothetical protein